MEQKRNEIWTLCGEPPASGARVVAAGARRMRARAAMCGAERRVLRLNFPHYSKPGVEAEHTRAGVFFCKVGGGKGSD